MPRNNEDFQYRGSHQPSAEGPRLHNLTENEYYPKDAYESLHHYGGSHTSRNIVRQVRGNPNAMVTIYRAAPKEGTERQWLVPKLNEAVQEKRDVLRTGELPEWAHHIFKGSHDKYHEWVDSNISDMSEKINSIKPQPVKSINHGDWVTLDRNYAKTHAEGREGYHILSATVPASHVRNDGNDLNEWGYFPTKD